MLVTLYEIGETYSRFLGTNDFPVKAGNEKLSAAGLRCRKFRLADCVKKLHEKARHTCSARLFFLVQPIVSLICGVVFS